MLYTVQQVAIQLGISKQSIYSKLKMNPYKAKIVSKQGQVYIDDELIKLIQDNLKMNNNINAEVKKEPKKATTEEENIDDIDSPDNPVKMTDKVITALIEQLKDQSLIILELNERLKQEQKLNENNQVLLKEKPQDFKLLEEHFQELDEKLTNLREEKMEAPIEENIGFWAKVFKK